MNQTRKAPSPRAVSLTAPTHVVQPQQAAEDELDFFFALAEGQMGLRSNYMDMLVPARHREPYARELGRRLDAATAYRVVLGRLRQLEATGEPHAGVLQVAFGVARVPEKLLERYGRLTRVMVRLATAEAGLPDERLREAVERRTATSLLVALEAYGPKGVAEVESEARRLYDAAIAAYAHVRGDAPCASPRRP